MNRYKFYQRPITFSAHIFPGMTLNFISCNKFHKTENVYRHIRRIIIDYLEKNKVK